MIAPILFIGGLYDLVLHVDGHDRRLSADAGRAGRHDPRAVVIRVPGRRAVRRARPRRRDRHAAVPGSVSDRVLGATLAASGGTSEHGHRRRGSTAAARSVADRHLRKNILVYAGLTFFAILAGLPVYWMFITTFKPDRDLYNLKNFPLWFNQNGVTLDHLDLLFNKNGFSTGCLNTLIVSVVRGARSPGRWRYRPATRWRGSRFRGAETLSIGIFLTYLVPTTLLFLPLVKVIPFSGSSTSSGR